MRGHYTRDRSPWPPPPATSAADAEQLAAAELRQGVEGEQLDAAGPKTPPAPPAAKAPKRPSSGKGDT